MSKHAWIGKYVQMDGQWWRIDAVHESDIDVSKGGKVRIVPRSMMDGVTLRTGAELREAEMEKLHTKQAADYKARTGKELGPQAAWDSGSIPPDYHAPSYETALTFMREQRDAGLVSDDDLNFLMSIYEYERLEQATPLEREQMVGDVKALIAQRRQRESYERLEAREAAKEAAAAAEETPQIIVH